MTGKQARCVFQWLKLDETIYRHCHEKTSHVSHYAFITLLHEWVDRGRMHQPKRQKYKFVQEFIARFCTFLYF